MPLLDLSDDLFDCIVRFALLQHHVYDRDFAAVLYPCLSAIRAICTRFNLEYRPVVGGQSAITVVGEAAQQLRAVQLRLHLRQICFVLEVLVITPLVHRAALVEAELHNSWECIACDSVSEDPGRCLSCGACYIPAVLSEEEATEYGRAVYGWYDEDDGSQFTGIGGVARAHC